MTDEQAASVIAGLTAAYQKDDMAAETIAVYIQFLSDIPYEAGMAAALRLIAENKFFPRVSELRQAALSAIPGNMIPEGADAWQEVIKQLTDCGYFQSPKFSHPAIGKAVKTIGWNNIRSSENPDITRAHFMKIYETYKGRAVSEVLMIPEARELQRKISGIGQLAVGQ